MTLFIARSRKTNHIYPMTQETLLRALKAQGSPIPQDDLEIVMAGRGVRRGDYVFRVMEEVKDTQS